MIVQKLSIVPALVEYHTSINSLHNPYAGSLFICVIQAPYIH